MSIWIYCLAMERKSPRVSVGFQLRNNKYCWTPTISGDCHYITEAQAGAHYSVYRFKADAVISLPSAVMESKVLKMNCVWQIISEQSIPVCLYYFEFISNKGDSGNWRGLVQHIKAFMEELCPGITCIFKRPQRDRETERDRQTDRPWNHFSI